MQSKTLHSDDRPRGFSPISRGALAITSHLFLFILAYFCAFGLSYNFKSFDLWVRPFFLPLLPIVVVIKMAVFARLQLFRGSGAMSA